MHLWCAVAGRAGLRPVDTLRSGRRCACPGDGCLISNAAPGIGGGLRDSSRLVRLGGTAMHLRCAVAGRAQLLLAP